MGAAAYTKFKEVMDQFERGVVLEIGGSKIGENDNSTQWFVDLIGGTEIKDKSGFQFFCIDKDVEVVNSVNSYIVQKGFNNTLALTTKFMDTLVSFYDQGMPVIFLYMDGFDYPPPGCEEHDWFIKQKEKYKANGKELTIENSADFHLHAAITLEPLMHINGYMLFDDTFRVEETETHRGGLERGRENGAKYPEEGWYGKGMAAIPVLESMGWMLQPKKGIKRDDWVWMKR